MSIYRNINKKEIKERSHSSRSIGRFERRLGRFRESRPRALIYNRGFYLDGTIGRNIPNRFLDGGRDFQRRRRGRWVRNGVHEIERETERRLY